MKTYEQRLNNIIGQLNGIRRMIDEEKEYKQILIQFKASRSALNSTINKYCQDVYDKCSENRDTEGCKKILEELTKNT